MLLTMEEYICEHSNNQLIKFICIFLDMIFMLKLTTLHFDFMFGLFTFICSPFIFFAFMLQTSIPSRNSFGSCLFVIVRFFLNFIVIEFA
jgi:hypothetical protein